MPIPPHYQKIPLNHPINPDQQQQQPPINGIPNGPSNYQITPPMNPQHMGPPNMHLMNMRGAPPPENQFQGPPNSRNFNNYMGGAPNRNAMMSNPPGRPNPHPSRMNSQEFINQPNIPPNNMPNGMPMARENTRSNPNLRYVGGGPNMPGVNMSNPGMNNMPGVGMNRPNVYQFQINSVNNIKNEKLNLVKKPKN